MPSSVEQGDARFWLRGIPRADLILTDPPHLDNFPSRYQHGTFVKQWKHVALSKLKPSGTLIHTCGASADELMNYLLLAERPSQILVWPHEVMPEETGKLFAPGHHFLLMHRGNAADDLYWHGSTFLPLAKPFPLWSTLISALTDPFDLVVDPFCGRGEIPAAAKRDDRDYLGCEILQSSVNYCKEMGL